MSPRRIISGFCNPSADRAGHGRCQGDVATSCDCPCHWTQADPNPLAAVAAGVQALEDALPDLTAACTDPQATDMALLLEDVREPYAKLGALVRDLEVQVAKAMTEDDVRVAGLHVERYRGTDRKAWQHEDWQRDVRRQALRKHGLLGAQGIVNVDGEIVPTDGLHLLLAEVQSVHGSAAPKTRGGLAAFGLDARDYCESSPGAWHVKVHRQADETEQPETEQEAVA